MKFSVLMSVYVRELPERLDEALSSIVGQTIMPNEVILVKDGPLTDGLERVIEVYQRRYSFLQVIALKENRGLGEALRIGLESCTFDIVARMDSDDICKPTRFERQLTYLNIHPEVDVLGSWIDEFSEDKEHVESQRKLPTTDSELKRFMKWRCPFNHMTVMFRKKAVLSVGSYQPFYLLEDYYLWNRLANAGCCFANIGESLVWARGGYDMMARRGGRKYMRSEHRLLAFMHRSGRLNWLEYCVNVIIRTLVRLMGNKLRAILYGLFLRKKVNVR